MPRRRSRAFSFSRQFDANDCQSEDQRPPQLQRVPWMPKSCYCSSSTTFGELQTHFLEETKTDLGVFSRKMHGKSFQVVPLLRSQKTST